MELYNNLVDKFKSILEYGEVDNPCVVFDIDGTIIIDGIFAPKNYDQLVSGVYEFLKYLQDNNIPIFIVTARPDYAHNRKKTAEMLYDIGINYTYLYMWDGDNFDNPTDFKTEARKDIYLNHYDCVMSLGDNIWDYGDYGGIGVHIYNDGESYEFVN